MSIAIPRRAFFALAAGALMRAADPEKRDMIVRSTRPEDLEMPLAGFSDYLTPIEHFFVRTHVYVPEVDLAAWRLQVEGEVATPLNLTMDDLRKMPAVDLVAVTECAGNGRGFYNPTVPGIQWAVGSVGNGRWRGVRLADVLKRAGVKPSAKEILFNGADVPIGTMPDFQRSIPVAKALDSNTLLAFEMNGQTLPVKHGFPLRVVAPGWASDSWMKWLTSIRVLDREHDGFWMKSAYRHPGKPVAPGAAIPPDQMQPVTSLHVKSVIAAPADRSAVLIGAPLTVRGVAWGGDAGPIAAVDVSTDNGRTWKAATLRADQRTQFGWRQWEYNWTPPREAYYTILARARDAAGNIQPLDQEWNPSGYAWNVVPRVGVNVVKELPPPTPVSSAATASATPPAAYRTACVACHEEDVIRGQRLTRGQWDRELTKMTGWGAKLSDQDRAAVLDYLAANYGPR
jgi:DMSO/TMAO reductase YedYZ molybdopterin-dependent catalytic subunit/mono/diheme cytochrome c family protein